MDEKNIRRIELIILSFVTVLYLILMVYLFGMGLFYEGILFSSIPIVLIFVLKFKMNFIKEVSLIILGTIIISYFILLYILLKSHYIFVSILLILVLIGFIYSIRQKKKVIIILLDSLYSFFRGLLIILIFIVLVAIVMGIIGIVSLILSNNSSGIYPAYINFIYN